MGDSIRFRDSCNVDTGRLYLIAFYTHDITTITLTAKGFTMDEQIVITLVVKQIIVYSPIDVKGHVESELIETITRGITM
jgi:hypothetical protein